MVGVGEVVEDCQVDAKNPHGRAADAEGGEDPVVGWERSPAEPEAAYGQESGLDAGEVEAAFRPVEDGALLSCEVLARDVLLGDANEGGDDCCDADGRENCTVLLHVEVVAGGEDRGDGGEGEIEANEAQAYVRGRVREGGVLWPGDLGREARAVAREFSVVRVGWCM